MRVKQKNGIGFDSCLLRNHRVPIAGLRDRAALHRRDLSNPQSVIPGIAITDSGQADQSFRASRSPVSAKAITHRTASHAQSVPHRRDGRHGGAETTDETIVRDPETEVRVRAVPPGNRPGLRGGGGDGVGLPAASPEGGPSWPLPAELYDAALEARLFAAPASGGPLSLGFLRFALSLPSPTTSREVPSTEFSEIGWIAHDNDPGQAPWASPPAPGGGIPSVEPVADRVVQGGRGPTQRRDRPALSGAPEPGNGIGRSAGGDGRQPRRALQRLVDGPGEVVDIERLLHEVEGPVA